MEVAEVVDELMCTVEPGLCIIIEGLRPVKTGQTQEQESAAGWLIMNRKQVSGNLEKKCTWLKFSFQSLDPPMSVRQLCLPCSQEAFDAD